MVHRGKNSKHIGRSYLLKYSNEINIQDDFVEKRLGLLYTTYLINCRRKIQGFDAVCKSTVNIAFKRLQPKRTQIHKIQQGTRNEDG